uniref:Sodium/potassium-transporting ATPase subunit beta n=1 Tax=Nothobranchius furzeri TaxID=105023 RepID=A0A8C6MFP6_NOTFU
RCNHRNKGDDDWKDSFYNPRTGEVLGRTASSWALILLFYLVFYCFLAGMFALTMWVLLLTLDDYVPRYRDRIPTPGLVIRPSTLDITFNRSDRISPVRVLSLSEYNDNVQEMNSECTPGVYTKKDEDQEKMDKVCPFKRTSLRFCSGLTDNKFGYPEGKPCVLLKLNRIIGLMPDGDPYINCTIKKDNPVQMHYFPREGKIDKMYFPYYGKKAHSSSVYLFSRYVLFVAALIRLTLTVYLPAGADQDDYASLISIYHLHPVTHRI